MTTPSMATPDGGFDPTIQRDEYIAICCDSKDPNELFKAQTRHDLDISRQRFIRNCEDLASRLLNEARRASADASYTLNSLGIVQGRAGEIDAGCAEIQMMKQLIASADSAARHAEKRGAAE